MTSSVMTSRDLLQLDWGGCFPHRLRYEWLAIYNQDPFRAAGEYERGCTQLILGIFLFLLTVLLMLAVSGTTNDPSILGVLVGAAIPIVLYLMSAIIRLISYRERGKAFAIAISKLAGFLEISVEDLGNYGLNELTERAKEELAKIAARILENETEGRIDAALQQRELFKTVHQRFVSFDLVGEKWDPFFAKAKQGGVEKVELEEADPLANLPRPGPNGGQPSAGILDLIREGNDVPDLTPNVAPEST